MLDEGLGAMIGCAVPDQDDETVWKLVAQASQHIQGVLAVGAGVGPDADGLIVVQVQAIKGSLLQARGAGVEPEGKTLPGPAVAETTIEMDMGLVAENQ